MVRKKLPVKKELDGAGAGVLVAPGDAYLFLFCHESL